MIAIGGAIGTGLVIGTGSALASAGPASVFIAYSLVGLTVYMVMCALGEMATYLPLPDGFSGYASRFVDPCLGFTIGYTYWFKYIIVCPNQLTAAALVMQYWVSRDKVNPGVWITILYLIVIFINYFGVKFFGEFEFWLSTLKVITILALIILLLVIALGGAPNHDRTGFRFWKDPGAFKEYTKSADNIHIRGAEGRFVSFASVLVTAVFAYLGTELVGVTVGEAQNPRRNIPRAIKLTFYRICVFYCVSVFLLGMCVAYDDKGLVFATKSSTSASASPFVVAIKNAKIGGLDHVLNACILLFVFSATNSDLYIATRTLYGLAVNGKAPKIFKHTNKNGVPVYALGFSSLFCFLAYMNCSDSSKTVFGYFVNLVSIFGLLTWVSILVSHIGFMNCVKAQGLEDKLVYRAPFQPYGTYISLAFCILICFIKNFTVFIGTFDYKNFITGYLGIPLYLILLFGYKFIAKSERVIPEFADMVTGKQEIDDEEERFVEAEREAKASRGDKRDGRWFYETFIGWIF